MSSSKIKAVCVVFVLFFVAGFVTVGCKQKPKDTWVNTNSMPGQTFAKHGSSAAQPSTSTIVYLGNNRGPRGVNFGPKDMSFEFEDLR